MPRLAQTSTPRFSRCGVLPPEAELLDQRAIPLDVRALEIAEQATPAPDELEQAAPRMVVLRVRAHVLGELVDAGRQKRHLHLGRAGVGAVMAVLLEDLLLRFLRESHTTSM